MSSREKRRQVLVFDEDEISAPTTTKGVMGKLTCFGPSLPSAVLQLPFQSVHAQTNQEDGSQNDKRSEDALKLGKIALLKAAHDKNIFSLILEGGAFDHFKEVVNCQHSDPEVIAYGGLGALVCYMLQQPEVRNACGRGCEDEQKFKRESI